MFRLIRHDEHGASAVLVALLMVPILGFVALAVDASGMYWEVDQLQNGADSAALADAQLCAKTNGACTNAAAVATAQGNANANDGLAGTTPSYPSTGTVRVVATTRTATGTAIDHPLWDAIQSLQGRTVQSTTEAAQATAIWGPPSAATVPITISACDFARVGLQSAALAVSSATHYLIDWAQSGSTCPVAGAYPPGGFSWLVESGCIATITSTSTTWTAGSNNGNSYDSNCDAVFTATLLNKRVVLPIFTSSSGTGSNATYNIAGFATFVITGWRFSGGNSPSLPKVDTDPSAPSCTGNCRGIQGYFVQFTRTDLGAGGIDQNHLGSCAYGGCYAALIN